MSFVASKLLWLLASPDKLALAGLLLGTALLWSRWRRAGRIIVSVTVSAFLVAAVLPLSTWLLIPLENRFPPPAQLPERVDGIIVLGGAIDQFISIARGQPALGGAAERMITAVELARRYPQAKLVFSGGSGSLSRQDAKEADVARWVFAQMGLDTDGILFEDQSRNTWENAVFTYDLVKPTAGGTWLLVTSASHMPRAIGCFRKVGWPVLAVPVDYQTEGVAFFGLDFHPGGLAKVSQALKEWVGLAAYRVMGRTANLFPAAAPSPVNEY